MAQIISHRGANKKAPQNTLSAFRLAREMKCDGLEFDLHLTKDGYVVVCHNYDIDETSNGSGLIKEMTFETLRSYDFGSYFKESFKGEKIPLLDEVLEISKGLDILDIEIKPPLDGNLDIVEKTLEGVEKSGLIDKLLISSFSDEVLLESKRLKSSVPTGLLYDPNSEIIDKIFDNPFLFAKSLGCDALHPVYFYIDEDYIQEAHQNGFAVNAWTCNSENVINTLIELDCDGIITDVPDLAFRLNNEKLSEKK
ncbi:MAG: Glycerophosphoryl diester phosphodiesterase [Firmicutes bacterium ADurb.Bin300]|jgi:glycerophosphoryl diester phosphodiesterase|nr:MAG: Glycerophosphoryl diester phosphodiesterase [Firmicutes bacterium ADurb.Bin300]HOD01870.1 glycerophosphodiester phosphodiesterase family protein [Clostridiales bacterium]